MRRPFFAFSAGQVVLCGLNRIDGHAACLAKESFRQVKASAALFAECFNFQPKLSIATQANWLRQQSRQLSPP
jgi:hypothetical protein